MMVVVGAQALLANYPIAELVEVIVVVFASEAADIEVAGETELAVTLLQTDGAAHSRIELGVRYEIAEVQNLDFLVLNIAEEVGKLDVGGTVG